MQIAADKGQNFSMDYTTKSGKHLSFSMYDNQSLNYKQNEEGMNLSLKRQYGFSFSFEGSKLTQNEIDEIKTAMKDLTPMMEEFLANSKVKELNPKALIESAMKMADVLPSPNNENHQNAIMNNFTNKLENLIKQNQSPNKEQNFSMLEDSKKLIEEILEQMKKQTQKTNADFGFYA